MTTTITKAEKEHAINKLRELLQPGQKVYTVLKHVSDSGMSRSIDICIPIADVERGLSIMSITYFVARVLGNSIDQKHGGVKITGCGMDMGFAIVYRLGYALWPDSTDTPHGMRNGEPDTDGGYALKQEWI